MALSRGCTISLIVFAVFVVIIVVGGYFLIPKLIKSGINYVVDQATTEMVKNVPDGYTEEQVRDIMAKFKSGIENKEIDGEEAQRLSAEFQTIMADKVISKEEGGRLLYMIQEALDMEPLVPPDTTQEEMMPDSMSVVPDSM